MGITRTSKALAAIISSITVFGVTVVMLDDCSQYNAQAARAPITSPAPENAMHRQGYDSNAQGGPTATASQDQQVDEAGLKTARAGVY